MNMNIFPLALSQNLEGKGERLGVEWRGGYRFRDAKPWRLAVRRTGFFPWLRAARRDKPPMWLFAICDDA